MSCLFPTLTSLSADCEIRIKARRALRHRNIGMRRTNTPSQHFPQQMYCFNSELTKENEGKCQMDTKKDIKLDIIRPAEAIVIILKNGNETAYV